MACPAFRVPGSLVRKHAALLHAAVEGLQPSERFQAIIASRRQLVEAKAGLAAYNLIHLRVEQDWFDLCKIWSNPEAGRDNCMNNTDTVGEQLHLHGFEKEVPVVVVTSFPNPVPEALKSCAGIHQTSQIHCGTRQRACAAGAGADAGGERAGGLLPWSRGWQVHRQLGVHIHSIHHLRAAVAWQAICPLQWRRNSS